MRSVKCTPSRYVSPSRLRLAAILICVPPAGASCPTETTRDPGGLVDRTAQIFLAERAAPAMSQVDLHAIHSLLAQASRRLTESGTPIQLLRSTYLPTRQRWIGTFTAAAAETVHRTVEIAQLPAMHVSQAIELVVPTEAAH